MNQLHPFAKPPRKSVCQDAAKIIDPSWMIPGAVFVVAVALQNKFSLSSKVSRNPGSMEKTYTHALSAWGK